MSESSRKRAATSPLNPEFGKKSRLGLTDEELNDLNENLRDWIQRLQRLHPDYAPTNPEDVSTGVLVQTFQQIALNVLAKGCASAIDNSWTKVKYGEEHINLLSRVDQTQLASLRVEAREKGDWERFASHCASIRSHRFPHEQPRLYSAILQVEPPSLESNRTRGYARLREDQEAGTFIDSPIVTPAFVKFAL
jgi:hypothetical protein